MMNILPVRKQIAVLRHLVDGNGIRQTARLTDVDRNTVMAWLARFGDRAGRFLDSELHDLQPRHIQLDEQHTFVRIKSCNCKQENRILDRSIGENFGDYWIFVAFDTDTKLIASYLVDRRNESSTRRFVSDLANRIYWPNPHASDDHAYHPGEYKSVVQISSDAWASYRDAVSASFGPYATYGQVVKAVGKMDKRPANWAERRVIRGPIHKDSICTSHIERNNLTRRHFMRRLNRNTLCFSKRLESLRAATNLHVAHHNYCWKVAGLHGTPAMAAGLVSSLWFVEDLYDRLMSA